MLRRLLVIFLVLSCLGAAPALAQQTSPQGVVVMNFTRFEPVAQDVVVPAGQTVILPVQ